jgi:hypothetical protein
MANGGWEKIVLAVAMPLAWLGSFEYRLRGKVNKGFCDERSQNLEGQIADVKKEVQKQGDRIMTHLMNQK